MKLSATKQLLDLYKEQSALEDYQSGVPRWCTGCGDNAILTAVQRLCRDEGLRPEKTVFVSGIGCSSRFPHYMKTYGFHGIHGRAFPIAEGVKMARPDLTVFVNTGDGDCCSIGAAHWIHALRYNMNMTVFLHDNQIYGLTKKQASPTSPIGTRSNTTPRGSYLDALNPLTVSLGVSNVSFIAQAVDWIPETLFDIVKAAYPTTRDSPSCASSSAARNGCPNRSIPGCRIPNAYNCCTTLTDCRSAKGFQGCTRTRSSTIRWTSTGHARSPRTPTPSRLAFFTETLKFPATKTRGIAAHCARWKRSRKTSTRNSTSFQSEQGKHDFDIPSPPLPPITTALAGYAPNND